MKLTKTPFSRGEGKLRARGLAVALAIGMVSSTALGIDALDYAPAERIILTNRHVLVFSDSGSVTFPTAGTVDVLVVGGGGGGGMNNASQGYQGGGGGGGGGVVYKTSLAVTATTYPVIVGAGGAIGQNGGNSSALGVTAYGGGGGANYGGNVGNAGASGGGATSSGSYTVGGSATHGNEDNHGNAGGAANHIYGAGGGGGAGDNAAGGGVSEDSVSTSIPGAGGDGYACDIVGTNVWYGGGGAGYRAGKTIQGGQGGGGACVMTSSSTSNKFPGSDGQGGGGCGGCTGGKGIVIISYVPDGAVADTADFMLSGGDVSIPFIGGMALVFTQNGTLTVTGSGMVELLAVGGGGGGGVNYGNYGGGGGGGGGVVHLTNLVVSAGTYDIQIGTGGVAGVCGGLTKALGTFAFGGGAGGNAYGDNPGLDGASGGGAAHRFVNTVNETTTNTVSGGKAIYALYGNKGCAGGACTHVYGTAGGGGACFQGVDNTTVSSSPTDGGDGYCCSISGTNCWYGGGGSGYRADKSYALDGGAGGGGGYGQPGANGQGGGGCGGQPGGSGIVIVRFRYGAGVWKTEFDGGTGGIVTRAKGHRIHTFTNTAGSTFVMPCAGKVDMLLVGGGGGGGTSYVSGDGITYGGGGGGGGGVIITNVFLAPGVYAITVGEGGEIGSNGTDSSMVGLVAYGGGGGARGLSGQNGKDGASGGGAASKIGTNGDPEQTGGLAIHGVGEGENLGNVGGDSNHRYAPGGGGGAGERGGSSSGSTPGKGGDGVVCGITGVDTFYGGGGAGFRLGSNAAWRVDGGNGGGGKNDGIAPIAGVDGLGGGGCGGAKGGSGIVIIRYKLPTKGTVISFR